MTDYFNSNGEGSTDVKKESNKDVLGYKCVLSSKASEESMVCNRTKSTMFSKMVPNYSVNLIHSWHCSMQANFARWEPAHGRFNFGHPWRQYLKIGASLRSCAYCIEALNGCLDSENQVTKNLNLTMFFLLTNPLLSK